MAKATRQLSELSPRQQKMVPVAPSHFPSVENLKGMMNTVKTLFFPDFFDKYRATQTMRSYFIGAALEQLHSVLREEIAHALQFDTERCNQEALDQSERLTLSFIAMLPNIKEMLYTDVQAIYNNDPAAGNFGEIILSYPTVNAMIHYRTAHGLYLLGIPVIPRILTELAHSSTGIDINPGASIGRYFAIDHGTGVVIGQTCIIGDHVTLYQGVTLGAKSFQSGDDGRPVDLPRHPIIQDNVTIYSNASVLGRITVGHDSIIGGNVWVTEDVPPHSKIIQRRGENQ